MRDSVQDRLIRFLGLAGDPIEDFFSEPKREEIKRAVKDDRTEVVPDGSKDTYHAGRQYRHFANGETVLLSGSFHDGSITEPEIKKVQEEGLKMDRYSELRVYWSTGYSVTEARRALAQKYGKGKIPRGYGRRTLEKYLAAYNRAFTTTPA